jgi:hypothetical protein
MTTIQLRQWAFQNSQPDKWWLSIDSVTQEIPVTLSEIEERLKNGHYFTIQVLHTSQASMEHAPWVDITPQQATSPQVMQSPPIVTIPAAPPAISQNKKTSDLGELALLIVLAILIPLAGLIIGIIRLCKNKSPKEGLILISVSVFTMIVYLSVFSK